MKTSNAKIKILVVDDDHIMCELLTSLLRREGYNVVGGARDGEIALEMCSRFEPDVVCLDINMPRMGGIETLHALKVEHPGMKVVMVSAEATKEVVMDALGKGACGFIVKPFNAAKILDTLGRCTGSKAAS